MQNLVIVHDPTLDQALTTNTFTDEYLQAHSLKPSRSSPLTLWRKKQIWKNIINFDKDNQSEYWDFPLLQEPLDQFLWKNSD